MKNRVDIYSIFTLVKNRHFNMSKIITRQRRSLYNDELSIHQECKTIIIIHTHNFRAPNYIK